MALAHQDRMRSMILGGMGYAMVEGMHGEDAIVAALEAPSLDDVSGEPGRAYRKFAEQTGSDTLGARRLHAEGAADLHAGGARDDPTSRRWSRSATRTRSPGRPRVSPG